MSDDLTDERLAVLERIYAHRPSRDSWTYQDDILRLIAEIRRLRQQNAELVAEAVPVNSVVLYLIAEIRRLRQQNAELMEAAVVAREFLLTLRRDWFIEHRNGCQSIGDVRSICTCGQMAFLSRRNDVHDKLKALKGGTP